MSSSPFVAPESQEAQYGYDSLQEEIEEQYGSRAAQQPIENKQDLSCHGGWGRHSKSYEKH